MQHDDGWKKANASAKYPQAPFSDESVVPPGVVAFNVGMVSEECEKGSCGNMFHYILPAIIILRTQSFIGKSLVSIFLFKVYVLP